MLKCKEKQAYTSYGIWVDNQRNRLYKGDRSPHVECAHARCHEHVEGIASLPLSLLVATTDKCAYSVFYHRIVPLFTPRRLRQTYLPLLLLPNLLGIS